MKSKPLFLALFLCLYAQGYSQLVIPKKYREVTESPANGKKMNPMVFDMDNDLVQDTAILIESVEEFSKYKLLIKLSGQPKTFEMELFHSEDFAIFPSELKVNKGVLTVCYGEDNSAFSRSLKLRFSPKHKKIQIIGYDCGYRTTEGSCDKSYNLITGAYEVKNKILNVSPAKVTTQTGTKKTEALFTDQLTYEKIMALDAVGGEFETQ